MNNSMENILKQTWKDKLVSGKFTSRDDEKDSPNLSTDFYLEYFRILESINDSWNSRIYRP